MRGQIAAQVTQTARDRGEREGGGRQPAVLMRPAEDEQGIKTAAKTEMKL